MPRKESGPLTTDRKDPLPLTVGSVHDTTLTMPLGRDTQTHSMSAALMAALMALFVVVTAAGTSQPDLGREREVKVELDLASAAMATGWSAHLAVGEASFDSFTHSPANPIFTGNGDEQWPVNGFLYGGAAGRENINQTLYVGLYGKDYAMPWSMLGLSSTDGGKEWAASKGALVCDSKTLLYNLSHGCPDGSAVDDGSGGVHMVFDWSAVSTYS